MSEEKQTARENHAQSQQHVADLEVLHQVGLALTSIHDPDELIQHAVDIVREAFDYYYIVFLAYDTTDRVLWPSAYSGEHPAPPSHIRLPLGVGLTGLAAQRRELIVVNDTDTDPRYLEGDIAGVHAEAAFPIQRGERLFGVFSVTSQRHQAFDEGTVRTLTALTNQIAVALESAQLVAELQLMNKDLEAMLASQGELLRAVRELSSPVVPIFEGVLVMPLVGTIDATRAQQTMRALLAAIEVERARVAIIDITGVSMVDSHVARYLADAMQATRLVGAEPVLVGITPAVAQTMVEIRADLGDVVTRSDLRSGVAYALRQLRRSQAPVPPEPQTGEVLDVE